MCVLVFPPPSRCPPFLTPGALLGRLPGRSCWPPSASGRVAPGHRLGRRGPGQQADMKEASPATKVDAPTLPSPRPAYQGSSKDIAMLRPDTEATTYATGAVGTTASRITKGTIT